MASKLRQVYKEAAFKGTILRVAKKLLRSSGAFLTDAAERLPRVLLSEGILSDRDQQSLQRNLAFKDKHRGRRCFVIGNGTSLKTQDLSALDGEITFVVNSFWEHPIVERWQPTYYSLIDPVFFELREPSVRDFYQSLTSRIHSSSFFLPLYYREPVNTRRLVDEGLVPAERTYFVAIDNPCSSERSLEIDMSGFIHSTFNVVQLNILAALYMGCSPIYLLGFDHDWLAHTQEDNHFYQGAGGISWTLETKPPNYQDRSYRALMERQLHLWHNYETMAAIAARRGIQILNATRGGYLDVFPRVEYEGIVGKTQTSSTEHGR